MAAKKDPKAAAQPDDELEDDETVVEDAEDEETPPEDTDADDAGEEEEDDLPDDPEELKKLVLNQRKSLQKVTKESVKRKKKIRALLAEREEQPVEPKAKKGKSADESEDDSELQKELAEEKKQRVALEKKVRRGRVGELLDTVLEDAKVTLASAAARRDLVGFVVDELEGEDLDDDDEAADAVAEAVKAQLKVRPYLKASKKKAPNIDDTTRTKATTSISEKLIEDVAGTMGLSAE